MDTKQTSSSSKQPRASHESEPSDTESSPPDTKEALHEDAPDPSTLSNTSTTQSPSISPWAIKAWLGLRAKLSQAPASYLIIFLLVQVWRLFQQKRNVDELALEARESFADDCRGVEKAVTNLQMFPVYAAIGASRAAIAAVDKTIQDIASALSTVLDGVVAIINFAVRMMTGSYRCLLTGLAEANIPFLSGISGNGVTAIDTMTDGVINLLTIPFTALNNTVGAGLAKKSVKFDSSLLETPSVRPVEFCTALVNKVSLAFLTDLLNKIFNIGFAILGALMFMVLTWKIYAIRRGHQKYESHVQKIHKFLNRWYSDNPPNDNLAALSQGTLHNKLTHQSDAKDEKTTATAQDLSSEEQGEATTHKSEGPIQEIAARLYRLAVHPLLFGPLEYTIYKYFRNHPRAQTRALWFFDYISQPAALACLKIGVLGLIFVQLQLFAIQKVRDTALDELLRDSVMVLSDIVAEISRASNDTAFELADKINTAILHAESDVNVNVILKIMNATQIVSNSLTTAENTILQGILSAFGNNILSGVITAALKCVLFNKVAKVQQGIAYIEERLIVSFPRVDPKLLVVDQAKIETTVNKAMMDLNGKSNSTNTGNSTDPNNSPIAVKIRGAANKMLDKLERDLRSERILYVGLSAVWALLFLVAIIAVCFAPVVPATAWW